MIRHIDHTKDIEMHRLPLTVASTDYCRCFELRSDTFLREMTAGIASTVILE